MATQTTPFQGTKFYLGVGLNEEKAVTAVTVKPNATITATGHGAKAGDFVKLTGLGSLDGYYPVKSVTNEKITLADQKNGDLEIRKAAASARLCVETQQQKLQPLNGHLTSAQSKTLKATVTRLVKKMLQPCVAKGLKPKRVKLSTAQSN